MTELAKGLAFKFKSTHVKSESNFRGKSKEIIVKVYVESFDDYRLWSKLLKLDEKNKSKSIKVDIKPYNREGNASGKGILKKHISQGIIEPGPNLMICLDSDFDYLLDRRLSDTISYDSDYIHQTYAHSAECFYYHPENLIDKCNDSVCGQLEVNLCIFELMKEWSRITYDVYIKTLYLKKKGRVDEYKLYSGRLTSSIESTFSGSVNIFKIDKYINGYRAKIEDIDIPQSVIDTKSDEYISFVSNLTDKGVNDENVYTFYRGHDIENLLLLPICRSIAKAISANVISEIFENQSDRKVAVQLKDEYVNNISDVRKVIYSRGDVCSHPLFNAINDKYNSVCSKLNKSGTIAVVNSAT